MIGCGRDLTPISRWTAEQQSDSIPHANYDLLQEKIVVSLQPYEQNLAGSQYGKYFVRNMNLLLLRRDPDAWRAQQSSRRDVSIPSTSSQTKPASVSAPKRSPEQPPTGVAPNPSSKRKRTEGDDIDKLFDSALGKKQKRSALPPAQEEHIASVGSEAAGLESVLDAIKGASKGDRKRKKKKAR